MQKLTKANLASLTLNDPKMYVSEGALNVDKTNAIIDVLQADRSGKFLRSNGLNVDPTYEDAATVIGDNSIPLSKMVNGTANNVLSYNSNGVLSSTPASTIAVNIPQNSISLAQLQTQNVSEVGKVLAVSQAGTIGLTQVGSSFSSNNFLHVRTTEDKGTSGGTSIAGWNQRKLNETVVNNIPACTVSLNFITLPAGTYYAEGGAVTYAIGRACIVLGNISASLVCLKSINGHTGADVGACTYDRFAGFFTLTGTTQVGVFHYTQTSRSNNGLGVASNISFGTTTLKEVFGEYLIWKIQ
jgi:hypothetical protein